MVNIRENLTLKACRIIAGIKAEVIAEAAGVGVDTVYKWEKGSLILLHRKWLASLNCLRNMVISLMLMI